MSFLSRETEVAAKVANFFILIFLVSLVALRLGLGPLTGVPQATANWLAPVIAGALVLAVQWKFHARVREWLDGGY